MCPGCPLLAKGIARLPSPLPLPPLPLPPLPPLSRTPPLQGVTSAFEDWVPKLRAGILVATAVDEPVQEYVAATAGCDMRIVDTFAPFE